MINREILNLEREILLNKLKELDTKMGFSLRKKKGYVLMFINNKFFVRYVDDKTGKYIPLKRSLETDDREEAEKRAVKYREAFIADYYNKKSGVKDIYELFSNYYKLDKSPYLQEQLKREDRTLSPTIIKKYDGYMNNHFIPFLKENKFTKMIEINNLEIIKSFQDYLLAKNISAHTINTNITNGVIKPVYESVLKDKSCFNTSRKYSLKAKKQKQTGVPPQEKTIFILNNLDLWKMYRKDKIKNEKTYKKYRLFCLISVTTGLREGEVFYLQKSNLIKVEGVPYLEVTEKDKNGKGLKTDNSKRKVPLPLITVDALLDYINENKIEDFLFCKNESMKIDVNAFQYSSQQLFAHSGFNLQEMKDKKYHFHSLRLMYNTLINRSELKEDIIEHFMGHQVDMNSMKERYNNRNDLDDKFYAEQGRIVINYFKKLFSNDITYSSSLEDVEFKDKRGILKYTTYVIGEPIN
jgi:integrase